MRSKQFIPGDKVTVLGNDEGVEPGKVGVIVSKWIDTIYGIRTKDGFHWAIREDLDAANPASYNITEGDIVRVVINKHDHPFLKIGDLIQVIKVIEDVDYYNVELNGSTYWLLNFELAPYFPPNRLT